MRDRERRERNTAIINIIQVECDSRMCASARYRDACECVCVSVCFLVFVCVCALVKWPYMISGHAADALSLTTSTLRCVCVKEWHTD